MKRAIPLLAGLLFGIGLSISGMTNPEKVLAFLDISGAWDPSLAFVMAGAIGVMFMAVLYERREAPAVTAPPLQAPPPAKIDTRLLAGAALFGAGWGLAGFCPGPAFAGLASGSLPVAIFVVAMLTGMGLHRIAVEKRIPLQFIRVRAEGVEAADG